MSDNNSYFELQPNHFHATSSSSGTSHGSTAPEYTFPRRAPIFNMNQHYAHFKRAQWSKRAIVALVDWREIPDFRLQHIINSQWKLQGFVTVKAQVRNFYILDFQNEEDWSFMLLNGPWMVKNSLLVIQKWQPELAAENLRIDKVAIWLRFSGIPLELISNYTAISLGQYAGEVIELDPQNDNGNRLEFVRVKVLLDPSKPLLMGLFYPLSNGNKIWVSAMPERTFRLCEQCGRIGHLSKDCNWGLFKTYWELHQQQMTICQNNSTYLWVDPQYVHFQCPKRKTSRWHFRESTKIQVQYDQYGPRYDVFDEFPPPMNNTINADWSSDSSADTHDNFHHNAFDLHQLQNFNASPENGSVPSVGDNTALHGGHDVSTVHNQNETLSGNVLDQNSQPSDGGHVVQLAENFTPAEGNNDIGTEALNDLDNANLEVEAGGVITDGTPMDIPQSLQDLLCFENPEDFNVDVDDEMNGDEPLDQDFPSTDDDMDTESPLDMSPSQNVCPSCMECDTPVYQSHCGPGPLLEWAKKGTTDIVYHSELDLMDIDEVSLSNIFNLSEMVHTLFKDDYMDWANIPVFHVKNCSIYNWASSSLQQHQGLALVLTTAGTGEIRWDVCAIDLHSGPRILFINKFLVSIPVIRGPFFITLTNWFLNFNIWSFQLQRSTLHGSYLWFGPLNVDNDDRNDFIKICKREQMDDPNISPKRCKALFSDSSVNPSTRLQKRKRVTFDEHVNFTEYILPYTKRFRLLHQKKPLNLSHQVQRLKQLVRQYKPSFVFLSETKRSVSYVSRIFRSMGYHNFSGTNPVGRSGGTFVTWQDVQVLYVLWDWFLQTYQSINAPWIAIGDFNQIRGDGDIVWERLDRVLCNHVWLNVFPKTSLSALPIAASDHSPLVLDSCGFKRFCKRPFRFENLWLLFYRCQHVVSNSWDININSSPDIVLHEKLNWLRGNLRSWNKREVGNIQHKIKDLSILLEKIQNNVNDAPIINEKTIRHQLEFYLDCEETLWAQKARQTWLVNGDRCTAYFHNIVKNRRVQNQINAIQDDSGKWTDDYQTIQQIRISYFKDIFTERNPVQVNDIVNKLQKYQIPSLQNNHIDILNKPFTKEEYLSALHQMKLDGAPGLDGYNVRFYKNFWDIVKVDVQAMINGFFQSASMDPKLNNSYITLIPKITASQNFKDFRPISLANVSYKLVSKVMCNRLKTFLTDIIAPNQSAFLKGRLISDNILLATEVMHKIRSTRNGKTGWCALKLDIYKAYDKLSWNFIEAVLRLNSVLTDYAELAGQKMNESKSHVIQETLNKIETKLKVWMSRLLSQAARFTLIKSVINSYLVYPLSCMQFSKDKCRKIESLMSNFFWGHNGNTPKIHLQNWNDLCKSKEAGRLALCNVSAFNEALLAKHLWRIMNNNTSLALSTLSSKYFNTDGNLIVPSNSSWRWKAIFKSKDVLFSHLQWQIGDGSSIKTNHQVWWPMLQDQLLITSVADLMKHNNTWNTSLLNIVYDSNTAAIIASIPLSVTGVRDKLVWTGASSGNYRVKDAYKCIVTTIPSHSPPISPDTHGMHTFPIWKAIWKLRLPFRIIMFLWRMLNNNLPACSVLIKHHMVLDDVCLACGEKGESLNHIFLQCPFAKVVWFGTHLCYRTPTTDINLLHWLNECFMFAYREDHQILTFMAMVLRVLWRCHNLRVMEGRKVDPYVAIKMIYSSWNLYSLSFANHNHITNHAFLPSK
ncbi:reverse transcriptase [Senna tora]|uniref:Reverse transcriptase n=1 Tax=Senna tora TaxID=362788 RepID=A0A834ST31_9FABA|nr:reverse transcriptase [Senna tora]